MTNRMSNNDVVWAFRIDWYIESVEARDPIVAGIKVGKQRFFVEFHNVTRVCFADSYSKTICGAEVEEKGSHRNLQVFDLDMELIFDIDYEFCTLAENSDKL